MDKRNTHLGASRTIGVRANGGKIRITSSGSLSMHQIRTIGPLRMAIEEVGGGGDLGELLVPYIGVPISGYEREGARNLYTCL